MEADSRETVFSELRKRGIKAIKVVAADGSKANGEVHGVSKRMVALAVFVTVLATSALTYFTNGRSNEERESKFVTDMTRRQVIGDAAVIELGIRTGWSDIFKLEGDRFLASFAIPGVPAAIRSTTVEKLQQALDESSQSAITPNADLSLEARQICSIVSGMKKELRRYLESGGTLQSYGQRLTERQDAEIAIYERMKSEIENAAKSLQGMDLVRFWETRNNQLRSLGIKLVALPE